MSIGPKTGQTKGHTCQFRTQNDRFQPKQVRLGTFSIICSKLVVETEAEGKKRIELKTGMKKLKHIMLIDDDKPTNFLHEIVLETADCCEKIVVFDNGQDALKYLQNKDNPTPDLLFLDIDMPQMSGWTFLEEYARLLADKTVNIDPISRIHMLSHSTRPKDKQAAAENKLVASMLNKPLRQAHLDEIFSSNTISHV